MTKARTRQGQGKGRKGNGVTPAGADAAGCVELRGNLPQKSKRGRPRDPRSIRSHARRLGISPRTIARANYHAAGCDRYPFLKKACWNQKPAMEVIEALDAMPEGLRRRTIELVEAMEDARFARRLVLQCAGREEVIDRCPLCGRETKRVARKRAEGGA